MNLENDDILENETFILEETQENEEPGETLEETQENEEPGETLEETQEETQENEEPGETLESIIDYSQDFIILENIGYFQLSLLGTLVLFFVMSLVIKFIKSFF